MTVTPLDAPRPLPAVPCPVYDGHPVQWEPWAALARMTHVDQSCPACAHPGPLSSTVGKVMPLPGETFESTEPVKLRSGRTYNKPARVPAWPVVTLHAQLCPSCFHLEIGTFLASMGVVEVILCDGCDAACAAGATLEEARHTLVTVYGGWSGPGADWDLCRACNPAATPDAPPRALAAFAASRKRAAR